jgi:hypothetical protein
MNGWKLVPVEATREMMNACAEIHQWHDGGKTWAAMLAASPAPVVTEEMITRAVRAHYGANVDDTPAFRGAMRAALSAALEVKGERG